MNGLRLFPVAASVNAKGVDALFLGILALSVLIVLLVTGLVVTFASRYRQGSTANRGELPKAFSREVEIGWTVATLFLALFIFWFASSSQLQAITPPKNALEIHVVAKQWMWKLQHPSGVREINALHVPVGIPVKLIMTSQDTIHDFYVPAFRMKQDVLPGRYTQEWFTATKTGTFPLRCAEYCGTDHSAMGGEVVVMRPDDYARWTAAQPLAAVDLAGQGSRLYASLGCGSCHNGGAARVAAPSLTGLYGTPVRLADGRTVTADEDYLRQSIVEPQQVPVAGYPQAMPSYVKAVDEQGVVALIAYLRVLGAPAVRSRMQETAGRPIAAPPSSGESTAGAGT